MVAFKTAWERAPRSSRAKRPSHPVCGHKRSSAQGGVRYLEFVQFDSEDQLGRETTTLWKKLSYAQFTFRGNKHFIIREGPRLKAAVQADPGECRPLGWGACPHTPGGPTTFASSGVGTFFARYRPRCFQIAPTVQASGSKKTC